MTTRVVARAFANIALVKYWGKQQLEGNVPATGSISLALDSLLTDTEVRRIGGRYDEIRIDGKVASKQTAQRLRKYIDLWRTRKLIGGRFQVSSHNRFPTGAGLASSASGFAALAIALSKFSERQIGKANLSRLAREGSGSAARSITGGLSLLPKSTNPAARRLVEPERVPWGMVVAVVQSEEKETGSREGMELSRKSSAYFKSWLSQSAVDYKQMMVAIDRSDFRSIGRIAEENALAMHACMIATRPPLVYWNDLTVELIRQARRYRKGGLETYITIDAGANVAFFCRLKDISAVERELNSVPGLQSVIVGRPAGGAEIVEVE